MSSPEEAKTASSTVAAPRVVNPYKPWGKDEIRIAIVGEAPGAQEEIEGTPFVGYSGQLLTTMLREAGIDREQCYITNVVNVRPPGNDFTIYYDIKGAPTAELLEARARLHKEIQSVNPNVVIALGNEALIALTGKHGIKKFRGSILESVVPRLDGLGPFFKVVSTYHPAAVARMFGWRPVAVMDLARAVSESASPRVALSHRDIRASLSFEELTAELERLRKSPDGAIAFDIETENRQVNAIAFSDRKHFAVVVPLFFDGRSLWSESEEVALWALITLILEDEGIPKIVQNANYDVPFLRDTMGIETKPIYMDTMLAHHCVYPEFEKGLGFLCSMYTDQPYYKGDIKSMDPKVFFNYNGLDAAVTKEVADELEKELAEFGVKDLYFNFIQPLALTMQEVAQKGLLVDEGFRTKAVAQYKEEISQMQADLNKAVGRELNVNSPKQMSEWLYKDLKLPVQTALRKGKDDDEEKATTTTDAATLNKFAKDTSNPAIGLVVKIRESKKVLSTYLEATADPDGRMRTSFSVAGTKSGRLSSSETIFGTGLNLQNVPKGVARRMYVPDPGCVFVQADLSQAEARVVAWLARETRLMDVFLEGGDIHRKNAATIFGVPESAVTPEQRQLAKKVVHASNYGMGPKRFQEVVFEEVGLEMSFTQVKSLMNMYHAKFPGIHRWHLEVQAQLRKNRTLVTPFGRKRMFFGFLSEDTFKEAYSYVPQSAVVDHLNRGLIHLHDVFKASPALGAAVLLQVHDSILIQCPEIQVGNVIAGVKACVGEGFKVDGMFCPIPIDFQQGQNWDDDLGDGENPRGLRKLKSLPPPTAGVSVK